MSGFVGLASLDGAPVDRALLGSLVEQLRFRGPDRDDLWVGKRVGLGHALFQTTDRHRLERQPASLDERFWISGDIRVDARSELVDALHQAGHNAPAEATDPELVLHAYSAWGEGLLDRLIGDFSFAIWDDVRQRLFCARDHLGVRPFYYARAGHHLVVSNTLSCIRSHPRVSGDINEDAIANFFLFGFNSDPATTTFSAIKRLPAGHVLHWSPGQDIRVERYWLLPHYEPLRLPRPADYVEQFRALLGTAVADRLRGDQMGVQMSGGLDSTLIAAVAKHELSRSGRPYDLRAHTQVYEHLFADPERRFSRIAARFLNIPIEHFVADGHELFGAAAPTAWTFPEPTDNCSLPGAVRSFHRHAAAGGRAAMTGFDGDALLTASWPSQLRHTATTRGSAAALGEFGQFLRAKAGLGRAVTSRLRRSRKNERASFPQWFAPDFAERTQLRDRWEEAHGGLTHGDAGPRGGAYAAMRSPNWLTTFESFDTGTHGALVEYRHPLADLRMVAFCLALPAIPWCVDKHVMRKAGRGLLPTAILNRPKQGLGGNPVALALQRYWQLHGDVIDPTPELARFIKLSRTDALIDETKSSIYWFGLRGMILNQWLNGSRI